MDFITHPPNKKLKKANQAYFKKDYVNAKTFYLKLCNDRYPEACNNLGALELQLKDYESARNYYKSACEMKLAHSCYNLGVLELQYFDNYELAKEYWEIACQEDETFACYWETGELSQEKKSGDYFKTSCNRKSKPNIVIDGRISWWAWFKRVL